MQWVCNACNLQLRRDSWHNQDVPWIGRPPLDCDFEGEEIRGCLFDSQLRKPELRAGHGRKSTYILIYLSLSLSLYTYIYIYTYLSLCICVYIYIYIMFIFVYTLCQDTCRLKKVGNYTLLGCSGEYSDFQYASPSRRLIIIIMMITIMTSISKVAPPVPKRRP